jgi:hypothetical protein
MHALSRLTFARLIQRCIGGSDVHDAKIGSRRQHRRRMSVIAFDSSNEESSGACENISDIGAPVLIESLECVFVAPPSPRLTPSLCRLETVILRKIDHNIKAALYSNIYSSRAKSPKRMMYIGEWQPQTCACGITTVRRL